MPTDLTANYTVRQAEERVKRGRAKTAHSLSEVYYTEHGAQSNALGLRFDMCTGRAAVMGAFDNFGRVA